MATWYATATGNSTAIDWNNQADGMGDTTVSWTGMASGDTVEANNFTVSLNDASGSTRAQLQTLNGGGFTVDLTAEAISLTANILAGTTTCVTTSGSGNTLAVTGNVTGGSASLCFGINPASTWSAVTITGNATGGTGSPTFAVERSNAYGPLIVTGTATATLSSAAIRAGYQSTVTLGSVVAANGVAAVVPYSSYFTAIVSGAVVSSADGTFPFMIHRIRLTGTASGQTMSMRDNSGTPAEKILKVPDYPAEAAVETGVTYDYATKTGTYEGAGGGGPLIGASALISG